MKTETTDHGELETWTPQEVADGLAQGKVTLVDVRTPAEYAFESVEGALLLPMAHFDPRFLPSDGDKRVVLMCGSSVRSGKMARKTLEAGAERIAHLQDGFAGWKKAGLTHIATDMASGAPVRKTPSNG
ncbi:rhodanese-like domain-containing protein [Oceanicola sp. D3]|uniref:rhodanese-like domain-containing protein n=1 Tax=Oceanicola sp. D3 TaxID=2587163 RepID=UPI001122949C|nr:rhodanese-like domain-containing protein [Oceanicola sp. D3]QDC08230.1 rhodanese-like domain-containing protein [Oceanicola sp. D3]